MTDIREVMREHFGNYIGPGSDDNQIESFKKEFPRIIEKYGIKTLNDAGCGRGWIKDFDIEYRGFDINEREHGEILDITSEIMPKADLIVCRDVLFHLTAYLILKTLDNFRDSGSEYLLATSCYGANNARIPRKLGIINARNDLTAEPFNLGEPLDRIEEPKDNRFLGLWRLNAG